MNGAVIAFAGSHAHTAGLLTYALGRDGRALLDQARATYQRLGAFGWRDEVDRTLGGATQGPAPATNRSMRRQGRTWHVVYEGVHATVPHSKGMADLAALLSRPGDEVHVLDLYGSPERSASAGEMVDRTALAAYRQRLLDLEEDAAEAEAHHDIERRARIGQERSALMDELRRVSRHRDGARPFATYPAERARKAVAGRLRDAIRKLDQELPGLAAHLDATIVTGMYCRYRATTSEAWEVQLADGR